MRISIHVHLNNQETTATARVGWSSNNNHLRVWKRIEMDRNVDMKLVIIWNEFELSYFLLDRQRMPVHDARYFLKPFRSTERELHWSPILQLQLKRTLLSIAEAIVADIVRYLAERVTEAEINVRWGLTCWAGAVPLQNMYKKGWVKQRRFWSTHGRLVVFVVPYF